MSGPGVGFEYPPIQVSWLKRDALLFANSIGCTPDELHFLYELDPNFAVFPTYPVILPFKQNHADVIDFYAAQKAVKIPGVPEFDARRTVDGQRLIQLFKPLPTTSEGKKFEIRTKVLGVYDKGRPGTVVETQTDLVDAGTGDIYTRAIGSGFYVGQGNWGGPKGPPTENFPPPKGKTPDVEFENQTTTQTPILYRLNGDYNPLHIHPEPGKKMGFGGVIIHGLYSWNWAAHGLLQKLGGSNPANMKEFQARFASPVKPGDKLVASVWRTGEMKGEWEEIRFIVKVAGGKVVLSNGRALMKVVGEAKSKLNDMVTMSAIPHVGDRLSFDGATCTVRYLGEVAGTSGSWLGVEWDDAARGKHDGSHKGVRYFKCRSRSATPASFVRPTRPAATPVSFITALQDKYTAELENTVAIQFSGKIAEEVGFEKTRSKQAQLSELRYAVLDGTCIATAYKDGDPSISETCPKVIELDLSRNLFKRAGTVVEICAELPRLRELRLNGNRFQDVLNDEGLHGVQQSLQGVQELALEETLMSWEELGHIATRFESLASLSAGTNQLSSLPVIPLSSLESTLTSLNLEFNDFTTIAQLGSLTALTVLRQLHLKGNNISAIQLADSDKPSPTFSINLQYLDVSYNQISSWAFVDDLPACFPGLTALRFAHNPIYDHPDPELSTNPKNLTEEAYMFTVGRLANLKTLNFGTISATDRQDAEMFYLAHIGKHLATVPETQTAKILQHHKRYAELCELYGAPTVSRRKEVNPAFLEARLVRVQFMFYSKEQGIIQKATKIPKSFDIYAVKGIAGRLFGVKPLSVRLIWETGEWDPVAGFDDEVEDSSDDEEVQEEKMTSSGDNVPTGEEPGKWVKREVELPDGSRQLGFCVDGLEARIRVEMR
ncbi:Thioesterase/thiol ester dehydrase-isomerase [Xylaria bambusicola]|uniref:Thioesterase/thiol ester dehydrase-isomerase n=1 Tax=Xylaria bambusicola TaxID=326684 RepID=UPI002007507D|nr:Thioesterase/thiol ester dehydrase-isomerase [Xylaria bambusicola]KAI0512475.1 Thioesterase/thiol ester dehydrase-isomerase [Xylaria bambusicola]